MEGLIRDYNDHQRIEQQATQIAMADHAYQLLAEAHEQQGKAIARLHDALADIVRDCELCDWRCPTCGTDYGMRETYLYSYAKQALKEEHP